MYKNLKFHSFLLYIFVMIFAIGCRGGGGQPPVTKPTQGDQPHAAQPEAPVATPVEDTAHGRKDAQYQGLNEASKAALTIGDNVVYEMHRVFKQNSQKSQEILQRALAANQQGTLAEVPKGTAKTEPESYIVDTEASDEGSSESPKGSHRSEEENEQSIEQLVTTAPQSSAHQATAAGN